MRSLDALLHSQVMTALYAEDGREIYANRALRDVMGPRPMAFGEGFADVSSAARFRAGLTTTGRYRETVQVLTQSGLRWYDIQAGRCRDAATGAAAFHISATDVTAMHDTEQALRTARDRARSADQAKSEFVASMSHEMRTPMNGILGLIELLSRSDLDDRQTLQVETLRESRNALLHLIEEVLDLSSIELRSMQLKHAPFDLAATARSVVEGLRPPAETKGLRLLLDVDPSVPPVAVSDGPRLAQLMRNLIGNAIKFTQEGWVLLSLTTEGEGDLRIEVADTGPGVPVDQRTRIFEKFHQVEQETGASRSGVGLGLSICQQIVEMFGGGIGVDDGPKGGACFWITIPGVFADPECAPAPLPDVPARKAG